MSLKTSVLNIICALHCEAKALIHHFKLKQNLAIQNFPVYQNQDHTMRLIVSGLGKINAACATTLLGSMAEKTPQAFLNLGIAGASNYPMGSLLLANKIHDASTEHSVYPKSHLLKNFDSIELKTHDHAVSELSQDAMIDMEAAGFYQAALKFTTQEFIQVAKIISDNSFADQENLTKQSVDALIQQQLEKILMIIESMRNQLKSAFQFLLPEELEAFHFSTQQKLKLERLIQRAQIFDIDLSSLVTKTNNSKTFIQNLEIRLEDCY